MKIFYPREANSLIVWVCKENTVFFFWGGRNLYVYGTLGYETAMIPLTKSSLGAVGPRREYSGYSCTSTRVYGRLTVAHGTVIAEIHIFSVSSQLPCKCGTHLSRRMNIGFEHSNSESLCLKITPKYSHHSTRTRYPSNRRCNFNRSHEVKTRFSPNTSKFTLFPGEYIIYRSGQPIGLLQYNHTSK